MFSTPIWSQNSLNTCKKILWWKCFIKFITLFSCHCLAIKNQTTTYTLNSMPSPAWKVQTSTESKNLLFILPPPPHPPGLFPCFSYLLFSSFWLKFYDHSIRRKEVQLGVRTRLSLDFLGQLFMVLYIFLWPVRLNLSNLILISEIFSPCTS